MSQFRLAFSLSKEEVELAVPPGTARLIEHELQRTQSGRGVNTMDTLRLVPEPSKDPADPLNWPKWRKFTMLFCISLFPFVANIASASLSSALPFLAMDFNPPVPEADLGHLIAVNILMFGLANLIWVPLANIFGRRPITLLCLLILTLCSVWCASAKSYNSLLIGRIFQGIGGAPSDTIAPDMIGELFFRHQRGRAMTIYTVFLALGPIVGGIIGSYIASSYGWQWTQWLSVILCAASLLLCALFQAETLFDRDAAMAKDASPQNSDEDTSVNQKTQVVHSEHLTATHTYEPFTFARSLEMSTYRGRIGHQFLGPYRALLLPGVWLVMLQYGGLVGGIVTISTIGPQLLSAPPYLWGQNAGLINVGGLVGSSLGAAYTYIVADRSLTRQAHRAAHGLSEPEARLPTLIPGLCLATTGLWVFGFCAAYPSRVGWLGLEVGLGMLTFGLMQVPSIGFNYIIESYHAISGDCFVMITCLRAVIGFAWTFFVGEWIEARGAAEPFGIFGMLMGLFGLLTIPIYLYGKRLRIATSKWLPGQQDH